ncbi:MAG: hypothetical protein ANABAC_2338 [Anaerolineae bacterium]|nr:MAG: hypothetical protein ANABAC_2338 [Anaerolineae bacterium]
MQGLTGRKRKGKRFGGKEKIASCSLRMQTLLPESNTLA